MLPVLRTFFIFEIEINKGVVSYCSFKNPGNWYISKKHIIEEKYSVLLKKTKKKLLCKRIRVIITITILIITIVIIKMMIFSIIY